MFGNDIDVKDGDRVFCIHCGEEIIFGIFPILDERCPCCGKYYNKPDKPEDKEKIYDRESWMEICNVEIARLQGEIARMRDLINYWQDAKNHPPTRKNDVG